MTTAILPGKALYTYSEEDVIWVRDAGHVPHNKRHGEVDSVLTVAVRSPLKADWVNFTVDETTTTKNYDGKPDRTASRVIAFSMTKDQFAEIAAHIQRQEV